MTQIRTYALAAFLISAFTCLALALLPDPGSRAQAAVAVSAPVTPVAPAPVDRLVAGTLGGRTDYTTVQVARLHEAADRVCEGFVAQVPLVEMEPELVREFSFTGQEAHRFVKVAHQVQCPLF
jgi:hypothetical protein